MKAIKTFQEYKAKLDVARKGFSVDKRREYGLSQLMATCHSEFFVASQERDNILETIHLWVDGKDLGALPSVDYEALFLKGTPAPYGHGEETKVDATVRDAREITADRIKLTDQRGKEENFNCWLHLRNLYQTRTELHKIQLYGPGGHFKAHQDTIHGPDHMATLLMFMPTEFDGGELVVRRDGRQFKVNEGSCMFFTDCEHSVEPVTSGIRVTLQFDVYGKARLSGTPNDSWLSENEDEEDYEVPSNRIQGLGECVEFMLNDEESKFEHLCLVLKHDYTHTTLNPDQLRGFDATLYQSLKELGYDPKMHACIINQPKLYEEGPSDDWTCAVVDEDLNEIPYTDCIAILCGVAHGMLVDQERAAYTGNEAVDGFNAYCSACLVITNPVSRKRKATDSSDEASDNDDE